MFSSPYLLVPSLMLFALFFQFCRGKARQIILLFAFLILLNVFLTNGLTPTVFAIGLALLTIFTCNSILRVGAGIGLLLLLLNFKIQSANYISNSLPFLVALPIGYSYQFYSILGLWIEEYRKQQTSRYDFVSLCCALIFAPALIAGPYVPASYLLKQFESTSKPAPNYSLGFGYLTLGFLKKGMADAFAIGILSRLLPETVSTTPAAMAQLLIYSLRVYFDFSGYSDAACGAALLLGYELPINFRRPFSARTFSDFWSRWNLSLSEWFKKYLFYPLMVIYPRFKQRVSARVYSLLATGLVCGLIAAWHGVNMVFLVWFIIVLIGLWLPLHRFPFYRFNVLFWTLVSTSIVLSGSVGHWVKIWTNVFKFKMGQPKDWIILAAVAAILYLGQRIDEDSMKRVVGQPIMALALGAMAWFFIFLLAFSGRPFLYAGF